MNESVANFELGKMQHREYETEASRYWGLNELGYDKSKLLKKTTLAVMLKGITSITRFIF